MSNSNPQKKAKFDGLKYGFQAVFTLILGLFGVHEVLFLLGLGGFFYGVTHLLSIYAAFAVCGVILMLVAILSVIYGGRKSGEGDS